jgi:hypothetical protein
MKASIKRFVCARQDNNILTEGLPERLSIIGGHFGPSFSAVLPSRLNDPPILELSRARQYISRLPSRFCL